MNSLDIFTVRALMQALEQIHSTMHLQAMPEKLFSPDMTDGPGGRGSPLGDCFAKVKVNLTSNTAASAAITPAYAGGES